MVYRMDRRFETITCSLKEKPELASNANDIASGNSRMKVLHVLSTIDPAYGGPVEAARLYSSIQSCDYSAEILTLDSDAAGLSAAWTVQVHAVGHSRIYSRYSSAAVQWLKANASRFDAVVVHGVWGYHLVAVWRALRNTATPYFVILHGMLNPWFKRTYPLKHFKKTLAWRMVVSRTLRESAGVLYLCEEERRLALSNFEIECPASAFAGLGTPASAATPDRFFARFPNLRSRRILLFLGRICHMKGCDLLLRAFAEAAKYASTAHLVMCGPDYENLQGELEELNVALGLSGRVTWTGPLYGAEKYSAFAAADLLVLPSRCETFPISVIEALGSGTPVADHSGRKHLSRNRVFRRRAGLRGRGEFHPRRNLFLVSERRRRAGHHPPPRS